MTVTMKCIEMHCDHNNERQYDRYNEMHCDHNNKMHDDRYNGMQYDHHNEIHYEQMDITPI